MQGNERRGSRRLQRQWSEIGDILEGGDIPIFRRLGHLGSIVYPTFCPVALGTLLAESQPTPQTSSSWEVAVANRTLGRGK